MTDVWLSALGFALMPMVALISFNAGTAIRGREPMASAALMGVVLFLDIAHAGADVLVGNAFLKYQVTPVLSAATAAGGALTGLGAAALLWVRRGDHASGLLAVSVAYSQYTPSRMVSSRRRRCERHSDGYPLTPAVILRTLLHRFAEGALIVVPAIFIGWEPPKAIALLLIGVLAVSAAHLPIGLFASPGSVSAASTAQEAIKVFGAAAKLGFAMPLILVGLLPHILPARGFRPAAWVGIAFLAMLLIHFTVE